MSEPGAIMIVRSNEMDHDLFELVQQIKSEGYPVIFMDEESWDRTVYIDEETEDNVSDDINNYMNRLGRP